MNDPLDPRRLHTVEIDGVRVRYYEAGQGEPLVIFGGGEFGSLDSLDRWSLTLPLLARHFRVICVDKLGQGHSGNPPTDADYTFEYLLRHTRRFLEVLGLENISIAGQSRGGLLVTRLAIEHPGLVKNLIIVDSATLAPESPMFPSIRWYQNITGALSPNGEPNEAAVRVEVEAQAFDREQVTRENVERMLEIARLPKFKACQEAMGRVRERTWIPSLDRARRETIRLVEDSGIPASTLIMWGLNDLSAPLISGVRLMERIAWKTPDVEMHVVPGAGHYSYREQPERFTRAVASFCEARRTA